MRDLFYSENGKLAFWVSGYDSTYGNCIEVMKYFDTYTKKAAEALNTPIENIRTDVIRESRRYKGMRFFYADRETAPENAFFINSNDNYWNMMKWLTD